MGAKTFFKCKKLFVGVLIAAMCVTGMPMSNTMTVEAEEDSYMFEQACAPENVNEQGYDIILVADHSESMWEQRAQRDKALRSISSLAAGSDIRIGAVYFGNKICKTLGLTSVEDKSGLEKVQSFLTMEGRDITNMNTDIGLALETALGLFKNQDAAREKVVILFSDGINTTSDADEKTRQQVEVLEKEGIPVYCVYLQKEENHEDYLKEIVNYFKENDFDEERFKSVKNDEIDTLSHEFAKIFYSAQNNMRYAEISVDSTGVTSFYVPNLGVSKLQLHAKNDNHTGVKLEGPQEQEMQYWADQDNWYISVQDPQVGDWKLTVTTTNPELTKGTIAYYADLFAYAELLDESGEALKKGSVFKNQEYTLQIYFFDEDGNRIEPDDAATIKASIDLNANTDESIKKELTLSAADFCYQSEGICFEEYGTYTVQANIQYEDFIDLSYKLDEGVVEGRGPMVYDKSGTFLSKKGKDGFTFNFDKEDLFEDLEGDEVSMKVIQINKDNPVEISEENGIITVTAKKRGDINFAIDLEDQTGFTSRVTIEGKVQNKVVMDSLTTLVSALLIIFIVMQILKNSKKRKIIKKIETARSTFSKHYDNVVKETGKFLGNSSTQVEEEWNVLIENIKELASDITEEQLKHFGLFEYVQKDFLNVKCANINEMKEKIVGQKKELTQYKNSFKANLKKERVGQLKRLLTEARAAVEKAEVVLSNLPKQNKKYAEAVEFLKQESEVAENRFFEAMGCISMPIQCDLVLEWRKMVGDKSYKFVDGPYCLDEVDLLGGGTVKSILGNESTAIYVYGYESEEEGLGLELRSSESFAVRNSASGGNAVRTNKVELFKGETYRITSHIGDVMVISVQ